MIHREKMLQPWRPTASLCVFLPTPIREWVVMYIKTEPFWLTKMESQSILWPLRTPGYVEAKQYLSQFRQFYKPNFPPVLSQPLHMRKGGKRKQRKVVSCPLCPGPSLSLDVPGSLLKLDLEDLRGWRCSARQGEAAISPPTVPNHARRCA